MARFKGGNLELASSNKIKHGTKTILDRDRKAFLSAIKLDTGTDINEFSTDGTLVGNSDSAVPTEKAVKAYIDAAGGGISYEIISGNTTAEEGKGYLINASNNDVTLTLPLSPSEGDTVAAVDLYNMATTNIITIGRNGENIEGESQDLVIDIDGAGFTMVFSDSTRGWTIVSEIGGGSTNYRYVDRGDPASPDWEVGDLTTDGTWRDLDCSSIVSSDAIAILFNMYIKDDATNSYIQLRKNGNSNDNAVNTLRTQVANQGIDALFCIPCDSNQVVEYRSTNTTFTSIQITILGWFTAGGSAGGDVCADNDMTDNHLVRADGGAKKIQECSTITVDDSGRMVNTGQPCFNIRKTTLQNNIPVNTDTTIVFDSETFDIGNNFASNTFTAPITGKYQFNLHCYLRDIDTGATYYLIQIITSNGNYTRVFSPKFSGDLDYYGLQLSVLADMDANDTAYCNFKQADGTQQSDVHQNSCFSGALIC